MGRKVPVMDDHYRPKTVGRGIATKSRYRGTNSAEQRWAAIPLLEGCYQRQGVHL